MSETQPAQLTTDSLLGPVNVPEVSDQSVTSETTAPSETVSTAPAPLSENWLDRLPEDLRSAATLQKFKSEADVVKSYVELEKQLGSRVKIPDANSTDEERAAFYAKLGRPETPDGYEIASILKDKETLKTFIPTAENDMKAFSELAHKLGLPKDATTSLVSWQIEKLEKDYSSLVESKKAELSKAREQLQKQWGSNFDTKRADANHVANVLASKYPAEMKGLMNSDASRNPVVMVMLAELASMYKENKTATVQDTQIADSTSIAEQQIAAIKADRKHPYWNVKHPAHAQATEEYMKLLKQALAQK